ncbi:hypothetical protein LTH96_03325 [Nesterenkonia sp. LB17]|uniref:hypothetical protein n=1 Tax=unclassified Nesterenkonia TaxID=2629769 RepID=UPI001F4CC7F1|nr:MULTISPECIES: hypothetical protein [unclassified Nesterenkonia]MCH8559534.1 hypothetical protein [Nesterenkonia sp. DZ6]MCH8561711.1 hypothetical protein [Nesterenkonia sp. YGD6]MCH8564774.1 hypothetical protein [Nesterenkonia sp. LB17]MCH8570390.1 hypothetical protein [Nesterenkonia sp. AY15]
MSAEAHSLAPASRGSLARSLSFPGRTDDAGSPARPSPMLRALPKLRGRQKGLIGGIIALLGLALTIVLAVNIHVANAQYTVVDLQNQHLSLVQANQALTEEVQHLESPQALSSAAVGLGMVMPAEAAALDLGNGEVTGTAAPADSGDRPSSFVASPAVPGGDSAAALNVSDAVTGAPSGILGGGALNTLIEAPSGQNGQEASAGTQDQFSPAELNGGTIPAPSFD